MKRKYVLTILLLAAMCKPVAAQYGDLYYHRTGDTIEGRPNNGYFEWWDWDYFIENNKPVEFWYMTCQPINLMRYYTQSPLRIVGIAGLPISFVDSTGRQTVETCSPEYFVVYEACADSVYKVGELEWNLADPHRYVHIVSNDLMINEYHNYDATYCCTDNHDEVVASLYEYYFDTPITVTDSFYVGGTCNCRFVYSFDPIITEYARSTQMNFPYGCKTEYGEDTSEFRCMQPTTVHLLTYTQLRDDLFEWRHADNRLPLLIYPIVEVDTTVPPGIHDTIPNDTIPNDTIVPPDTNHVGFTYMLPNAYNNITLSPNPAQKSVTVTSQQNLKDIDIYNTAGILVHSDHYTGHRTTIDLTGLPRGVYVMHVRTYAGVTKLKLAIE